MNENSIFLFREASLLQDRNIPFAFVLIVSSQGSVPRKCGSMIIQADGISSGTVGGGIMEKTVKENALRCIGENRSVLLRIDPEGNLHEDEPASYTDICIQTVAPSPLLLIVGGGHVAVKLAAAGAAAGFRTAIVEERPEYAETSRFPDSTVFLAETLDEAMSKVPVDKNTYVVLTNNSEDERGLRHMLKRDPAYIGMLGSAGRIQKIRTRLEMEGFGEKMNSLLKAPVGLDIGAKSPGEIAVSILSEILAVKNKAPGGHLSASPPGNRNR